MRNALLLVLLATAFACAGTPEQPCTGGDGGFAEESVRARELRLRVERLAGIFYPRIANRRFNSIATFQDPALREFFVGEEAFADYFANFVQALADSHFEQNRATKQRIEDICIEDAGDALITVRFWGDNSQPLRWWRVQLVRVDRWQSEGDRWWIVPGKL